MDLQQQHAKQRSGAGDRSASWIVLTVLACLVTTALAGTALASPAEDPPVAKVDALSQWRHIGMKSVIDAPCPDPGYPWAVRHLFGHDALDWLSVAAELRGFCVYELTPPGPVSSTDLSFLSGLALSRLAEDAMALTLQGGGLMNALWPDLEARFLEQGKAGLHLAVSSEPPTRLAIVDTSPDPGKNAGGEPETSRHGETLQKMAKAMACPSQGPCLVNVTPRLALAYISFDPLNSKSSRRDTDRGGFLGLLGDLAEAVFREVRAWEEEPLERPLVINLSIGWDGNLFGGLEGNVPDMRPAVQAVYQAMDYAACKGAVIVAAAGNYDALRDVSPGPLLPAAWESRPRSCPTVGSDYQPFVYAAAGIRADGTPLPNARPSSSPPLAAYADHTVVAAGAGQASAVLTGSSVASLLVATSAASLWHHMDDLHGPQIMDKLHESGNALAQAVDFACLEESGLGCPAQPTDRMSQVHRVSLCSALKKGCDATSCEPFSCLDWAPSSNGTIAVDTKSNAVYSALGMVQQASSTEVCAGQDPFYNPLFQEPRDPCPFLQYSGTRTIPWLHPQPGMDPCPVCIFQLTSQSLAIEIDDDFQGELVAPTLQACGVTYSFNEVETPLVAGDRIRIDDLELSGCTNAVLSFKRVSGGSASSSLLISH